MLTGNALVVVVLAVILWRYVWRTDVRTPGIASTVPSQPAPTLEVRSSKGSGGTRLAKPGDSPGERRPALATTW
jgi:hypothetical protein